MIVHRRPAELVLVAALLTARLSAARDPSMSAVLRRSAAYVAEFERQLAGIVAEETYVQTVDSAPGARPPAVSRRELKSDFLLARMTAEDRYVDIRDVFEVDGRPVREHRDRLTRLFLNPGASRPEFDAIIAESARYNIGAVRRTLNTPTLSLLFLAADMQSRFKFKRAAGGAPQMAGAGETAADSAGHFRVSTEVWVIDFQETERGTVIRTPAGRDLPARGRFWIEPATGRVLMSELIAEDADVKATIDVSYQSEPLVGLLVPVEMRERYVVPSDGSVITGTATYGRFRQP